MLYAVVDIETTGGFAASHGITEIAIKIYDGLKIIESYETLINPYQYIPAHIEALTGIDNEMVANAPDFRTVSETIYNLLDGKVFVAHNVNFDFSFVNHHLVTCGYNLNVKKLCTVRLSRKLFPGLTSYSLGKLCKSLSIPLNNRHRASGDADATTILLGMLIEKDTDAILDTLKKTAKVQTLPPNLSRAAIDIIPDQPGVYYFKDEKGKVIYVGKAKQLKKRICSHFSGNNITKQRQIFLKCIYSIDYQLCGTELMALILEESEIKKYWPENNKARKRVEQKYSLYQFEDQNGYVRLLIDKFSKNNPSIYSFNNMLDGYQLLREIVKEHQLCEKLCFIQKGRLGCTNHAIGECKGACIGLESKVIYNFRVKRALNDLQNLLPSFAIVDEGRTEDEKSCLYVECGKLYGMGYISYHSDVNDVETLKSAIIPFSSNDYIMSMIYKYSNQFPQKMISLKS